MKSAIPCFSYKTNIIDVDRRLSEVRCMALQDGLNPLQLICLQFIAQRQMKAKFIHHERIAPFCQQGVLCRCQTAGSPALQLSIAQRCTQVVQLPHEAAGKLLQGYTWLMWNKGKERSESSNPQGRHLKSWRRAGKSFRCGDQVIFTYAVSKLKWCFQRSVKSIFAGPFGNYGQRGIANLRLSNGLSLAYTPAQLGVAKFLERAAVRWQKVQGIAGELFVHFLSLPAPNDKQKTKTKL